MSKTTRGRPVKNTNVLVVNDLLVEFLSTKKDNYDQEISYLKLLIPDFELN